jgi:hypothetical protein
MCPSKDDEASERDQFPVHKSTDKFRHGILLPGPKQSSWDHAISPSKNSFFETLDRYSYLLHSQKSNRRAFRLTLPFGSQGSHVKLLPKVSALNFEGDRYELTTS